MDSSESDESSSNDHSPSQRHYKSKPVMDRERLLPIRLPPANGINASGSSKGKPSMVRRFALAFVILAVLGLLYVPAYHLVQGPYPGLGETPSPVATAGTRVIASVVAQLNGWGIKTPRNVGLYVHPDNATTIISPKNLCSDALYLLIVVCSAVSNQNARNAIRNTWANTTYLENLYNSTVKVVFLLGQSDNSTINNYLADESFVNNDIIQEQFLDTYNNLTLKSVMLLKWITSNCNKLVYTMKTDDDMYVNVPALVKNLKERKQSNNTLIGTLICNAKPILDPKNKWYTPKYMFSGRTYPNYLSGTGYVMSLDVATKLYRAALETPLLHLEDVYITGVCAKHAKLRPVNHAGFSYLPRKIDACSLKDAITAHKVSALNMYKMWNKLHETNVSCSKVHSNNVTSVYKNKSVHSISRLGRHQGYLVVRSRVVNKCV